MKILFVSNYYYPYVSGITVYLKRLAEGLAKNGNEVTILTSQHEKNLPANEKVWGVNIVRCPVLFRMQRGAFAPTLSAKAAQLSRDFDVVNIHAPMFEAGLIAWLVKHAAGKKPYLTYHCDLSMREGFVSKIVERAYYFMVRRAAKNSEKIVVNSLDYLDNSKLKEFMGKAVAIFPPIDLDQFKRAEDVSDFRKRHNIPVGSRVVGFVGRLTREKGVSYLVSALPKIQNAFPETKLLIGGDWEEIAGGKKESVKKIIDEKISINNLPGVVITGRLSDSDLVKFYSCCDVFVLPSIDPLESFGMVQVEAMLCGASVVATDLPGVREPARLTGFGLVVPPRDVNRLADAIIEILKNKEKFLVRREKITEYFGTDKTVKGYEQLFKEP